MNGVAFVERLKKRGYSKANATQVYYDFLYTLAEAIADGEGLTIPNFGRFEIFQRTYNGGSLPGWVSQSMQRGDKYDSVRFVPHKALVASVTSGIPVVIDCRIGPDACMKKFRRKKTVGGGVSSGDAK